jgi:predicted amidophosphoribosyltransferase
LFVTLSATSRREVWQRSFCQSSLWQRALKPSFTTGWLQVLEARVQKTLGQKIK